MNSKVAESMPSGPSSAAELVHADRYTDAVLVKNRATINGAIEIGRHPGVGQITMLAPLERLRCRGLLGFAQEQYDLQD